MRVHITSQRLTLATLLVAGAGCGSNAGPTPPPVQTTTVTITASGASPQNVQITQGQRVRFINNDGRSHNMTSDPHPEHTDCPEINTVGLLQPGQSRETGNLVAVRTCGFHDHDDPPPLGARWTGRITIR